MSSEEDENTISPQSPIIFEGYGYDLENGVLDNTALTWLSDINGVLGTGKQIYSSLSPGQHTITLQAIDYEGNVGVATKSIFVGYRIFIPSIQKR